MLMEEICTPRSPKPEFVGPAFDTTPAVSSVSARALRPLSGRSRTRRFSMTVPSVALPVSTEEELRPAPRPIQPPGRRPNDIHLRILIYLERDAGSHGTLEARSRNGEGVVADRKAGRSVEAPIVRFRLEDRVRSCIAYLNRSAGNYSVLLVRNRAGNCADSLLCKGARRHRQKTKK